MRRTVLLVALACLLALGGQAFAELCTIDAVPAATLLLPYFEVDLGGTGVDTLFSVNNASAAPTVAHVTLWGDWSLPSIDFDIFLTGYDVQTVSLRDVFVNGNLPITAQAANDQGTFPNGAGVVGMDAISPHGSNPAWDSAPDGTAMFPNCASNLPIGGGGTGPELNADLLTRIRNGHTGVAAPGNYDGGCIGRAYGDNIARGYITIDNVNDCNLFFPNSAGYYDAGLLSNVNQLWGDYFIIDQQESFAFGDNLVAIEWGSFGAGEYTFYGRYSQDAMGVGRDQREPLASTWGTRYLDSGTGSAFESGTDLLVWRDSKCQTGDNGFSCTGGPPWAPLGQTQVVAFDLQECALEICLPPPGGIGGISPPPGVAPPPTCFPIETGRYQVGSGELTPVFDFGWMYLNLNHTLSTGGDCSTDGLFGPIAQSWVTSNLNSTTFNMSVGYAATQLTSACSTDNPEIMGDLDGSPCPWSSPAD